MKRARKAAMAAAAGLIGGCATMADRPVAVAASAIEGDEIRYETSACYGTCPVYVVTIRPDGRGSFEGLGHTAATGARPLVATPDAYRRFAAALAPHRPQSGERLVEPGQAECEPAATDMPSIDVRWTEMTGAGQHLRLYLGCRGEGSEAMRAALRGAPDLLPIADLVGRR